MFRRVDSSVLHFSKGWGLQETPVTSVIAGKYSLQTPVSFVAFNMLKYMLPTIPPITNTSANVWSVT